MQFSIIIPTLNESERIGQQVQRVRALCPAGEVIVADGGSEDDTRKRAREAGAVVALAPRGRGTQCNAGAALAQGDVLLFLHADTLLPPDAFETIEAAFQNPDILVGTFHLQMDVQHWLLDVYIGLSRMDTMFTRFGDQVITVRRSFFESLGGFPDWPLFEDVAFLRRARRHTRIHLFPTAIVTSARRFVRNGVTRQALIDVLYLLAYALGASPHRLAQSYERRRPPAKEMALLFFARAPRPGRVKTRLAATLGETFATQFYDRCARQVLRESKRVGRAANRYLFCADPEDLPALRRWAGRPFLYAAQVEGDLGQRLSAALALAFSHGAKKAMVLATDAPDLRAHHMIEAAQALDAHDLAIGPSMDGGYYLLAMKRLYPQLFIDMPWSTSQVLSETLSRARALGLSVHHLPTLWDVDTEQDLRRWWNQRPPDTSRGLKRLIASLA